METKQFSIRIPETAGYDEVTDSIADLFEAGIAIGEAVGDGLQVTDALVAIQEYPNLKEVVDDFPVFLGQFTKLTPVTAMEALTAARDRVEAKTGPLEKIPAFIFGILFNLARGYGFAMNTYLGAKLQLEDWKALGAILNPPAEA
jgi:hypothetical protein